MARTAAGDHLKVSVRYAGDHAIDGVSLEGETWSAEISVGSLPFAARIRRTGATFVELDLYSDSSRFVRISDQPRLPGFGDPGRSHGLSKLRQVSRGLYHGTTPVTLPAIGRSGLRPGRRRYVHLATTPELALTIGRRRSDHPVLLRIDALAATKAGVRFHRASEQIVLAPAVPATFLHTDT